MIQRINALEEANRNLTDNNNQLITANNNLMASANEMRQNMVIMTGNIQAMTARMGDGNHHLARNINKSLRSVQICRSNNISAFMTELRTLFGEYEGTPDEAEALRHIIRAGKGRIQDADAFKDVSFDTLDALEAKLREEFMRGSTLKEVETLMIGLFMKPTERIDEYVRRTKCLKQDLRYALEAYHKTNNIPYTKEAREAKEKEIIEAFRKGLPNIYKLDVRDSYTTLEECIAHAREIHSSLKARRMVEEAPGTSKAAMRVDQQLNDRRRDDRKREQRSKSQSRGDRQNHQRGDSRERRNGDRREENRREGDNRDARSPKNRKCYRCGKYTNHVAADCTEEIRPINSKN